MGRWKTVLPVGRSVLVLLVVLCALMGFAAPAGASGGGTKSWRAFYNGGGADVPKATAASADGTRVFVTGSSDGPAGHGKDYATVAYNPSTGAQLWAAAYTSTLSGAPVEFDDVPYAIAVSPDGTKVYVTGQSRGSFATIAYNASTGAVVWTRLYSAVGPATAITASPDGSTVYVTGEGTHSTPGGRYDFATVAYNAATGAQLWFSTFNGTANRSDFARAITVTPDGARVIITGYSRTAAVGDQYVTEYVTIGYDATTGAQQWVSQFNAVDGQPFSAQAYSIAMSPDGSFVAVTGVGGPAGGPSEFATIAYDPMTGAQRWFASYIAPQSDTNSAVGVAVAPDASKVYVTGTSGFIGQENLANYSTVAYAAETGTTLWASTYDGPQHSSDYAVGLAVSGDGTKVVVTGTSYGGLLVEDYATVAYDTATGAQSWVTRHNFLSLGSHDRPTAITIVPGDHNVVVTGERLDNGSGAHDFATAAIAL